MATTSRPRGDSHPQDNNEAPARPQRRSSRLRSLSFCCILPPTPASGGVDTAGTENEGRKPEPFMATAISPIATLRRKAARATTSRRARGTVVLHPPRPRGLVNMSRISRRAANHGLHEPDEVSLRALSLLVGDEPAPAISMEGSPPKKRKDGHHKYGNSTKERKTTSSVDDRVTLIDPITLEELGAHQFVFQRTNGSTQAYNVESLADYILSSGVFAEPVSRIPFSDAELLRLDKSVAKAGLSKRSLLEARKDVAKYTAQKQARDLVFGIDRMLGDIVAKMMAIVESPDSEESQMELTTFLFPEFEMFFGQLRTADPAFAKQSGKNFVTWIRGPPNKPTQDMSGLLEIVVDFISGQANLGTN